MPRTHFVFFFASLRFELRQGPPSAEAPASLAWRSCHLLPMPFAEPAVCVQEPPSAEEPVLLARSFATAARGARCRCRFCAAKQEPFKPAQDADVFPLCVCVKV